MSRNPIDAYKRVDKTTQTGRELEAAVLTKAALALKECQDNWDAANHDEMLEVALKYNQMVWSLFQGELAQADNPLPKKLREDILSLSAFIDRRIFQIMAYPSPEKLTAIININMNIAAGLRTSAAAEEKKT